MVLLRTPQKKVIAGPSSLLPPPPQFVECMHKYFQEKPVRSSNRMGEFLISKSVNMSGGKRTKFHKCLLTIPVANLYEVA